MSKSKVIAEYSLHVTNDGEEICFQQKAVTFVRQEDEAAVSTCEVIEDHAHRLRVHSVQVLLLPTGKIVEQIEVRSVKVNCGERFICPRPRGEGWVVHDNNSDNFTLYRRPKPSGERQQFNSIAEWAAVNQKS